MEFDGTLALLQGTICSLGSRNLLNKEDSLQNVVEALRNLIENHPRHTKSKVVFFLVLNTQLSISEKLKDDELVGLFTNITPAIDKTYLIKYIYYLNLQSELFRIIENCPGTLGSELIDALIEKLYDPNFHRNEFGLDHMYQLWESVFVKVCKIHAGLHVNDSLQLFVDYFNCIYTLIQNILVISMSIKDVKCTSGLLLYNFLKSFLFCIKLYKNPSLSDDPLFRLSIEVRQENSGTVITSVMACMDLLWEKVVKIFENLTFDLWMTFSEHYFDFDSENSMQLLIGDIVHSILEEIKEWNVPSDILNCLSSLAINRLDVAGLDEIISNVRNGKKEWFEALLKHPDVCQKKSVECLIENINLASTDEVDKILNMSYELITSAEQDVSLDLMKDLFLTAMKKTTNYSKWLEKIFANYKCDLLITAHTQHDLTETFNKISKGRGILEYELISLCIQSPLETLKKICHLAVFGSLQIKDAIRVLKMLQHPCKTFQWDDSACINFILLKSLLLEDFTDKEKLSFNNLVVQMGEEKLLGPNFIKDLIKALKTHLENAALEKVGLCLEILQAMLNFKLLGIDEAALLVFLSQVLGHLTWDLKNYASMKADGRDLVVCIVATIINELEVKENDSKYLWVHDEVNKSCEINQACFCDLWFRLGYDWPSSGKLHSCILSLAYSHHKVHDLQRFLINVDQADVGASIILSLTMVLPVLTFREWFMIFNGLITVLEGVHSGKGDASVHHHVLDMFGSALYLLTLNLDGKVMYPCYEHCLRNFGRLFTGAYPKLIGRSVVKTVEKIFFILTAIEDEEERKSCWVILSPLLLDLIDCIKSKNTLDAHKIAIGKLLPLVDLKDIAEAIARRLA